MSADKLPQIVEDYLEYGTQPGERNTKLFNVAAQLRDIGWQEGDIRACLERRALSDGLKPSEITATLNSVMGRARREPPARPSGGGGSKIIHYKSDVRRGNVGGGMRYRGPSQQREGSDDESPTPIETDYVLDEVDKPPLEGLEDPTREYLKTIFRAGDVVQLVRAEEDAEGKERPSARGNLQACMELERWLQKLDDCDGDGNKSLYPASEEHGIYVCINPLSDNRRVRENILDHRHALIEFDTVPKHHQWQLIKRSNIPVAAIIDSGGKSIHAVVRVDAADYEEYQQRTKLLMDHFKKYGVDAQNCDPTRLSRLPGIRRGDTGKEQLLLQLKGGAETFTEWQASVVFDHQLPPEQEIDALLTFDREDDENCLIGERWLCKGGSMIISGQSGIGKSSFLMQMTLTFALGGDFFGIRPKKPLKSIVLQAENDTGDLAEAFQDITKGMELEADSFDTIRDNVKFFRDTVHTGEQFVSVMARLIEKHRPDVVWADPLLAFCGDDISKQSVASAFLRNMIGPVLEASGALLIFLHHTGKPQKEAQKSWNIKDFAYAGIGSSELANWARETISITRADDEEDIYALALSKRGKRSGLVDEKGEPASIVYLRHAQDRILWERAPDFTPTEDRGRSKTKRSTGGEDGDGDEDATFLSPAQSKAIQVAFATAQGSTDAQEILADILGISKRSARRRLREWIGGDAPTLVMWKDGRRTIYQSKASRDAQAGDSDPDSKTDAGAIEQPTVEQGWKERIEEAEGKAEGDSTGSPLFEFGTQEADSEDGSGPGEASEGGDEEDVGRLF